MAERDVRKFAESRSVPRRPTIARGAQSRGNRANVPTQLVPRDQLLVEARRRRRHHYLGGGGAAHLLGVRRKARLWKGR